MSQNDQQQGGAAGAAFRLQCKTLALTYPKCSMDKATAGEQVRMLIGGDKVEWIVVAQEQHEDGDKHLHICVRGKEKFHIRGANKLDLTWRGDVYHGNYKAAGRPRGWLEYISKEDGRPWTWPDDFNINDFVKCKNKNDTVALMIINGGTSKDVRDDHPGYYLMHKTQILSLENEIATERAKAELLPWKTINPAGLEEPQAQIVQWLNNNILQPREFKQKQLFIHGPANMGKTSLVIQLMRCCHTYALPYEQYFNDWTDDFDLVVLDEFKAQHRLTFLNNFMQGGVPMSIPKKGGQAIKKKNQPVIILSNYSPEACYLNSQGASLDAFLQRLLVVDLCGSSLFPIVERVKQALEDAQDDADEPSEQLNNNNDDLNIACHGDCVGDCIWCRDTIDLDELCAAQALVQVNQ